METDFIHFKRQEGFRFTFPAPLAATFAILKIQGREVETKKGEIHLLDISLKGAKAVSPLKVPEHTQVLIEFTLERTAFSIVGEFIWLKQSQEGFVYGVRFLPESYSENELLDELKYISRKQHESREEQSDASKA
ncbi:PilZ domain-containing protein [Brevibacillus ruminantium]|uniref:PilZ domain-containing protein n=1 Tax=Brevibacillus ruminantium TaxID=2950604 RepID=A0ABY4WCW1_9BACL|nr:PilZ domain-containing protein [Brevibacillus ruminantium]USG65015.1 PilZ domain-containing protein [Brevibacillus ruminantium]